MSDALTVVSNTTTRLHSEALYSVFLNEELQLLLVLSLYWKLGTPTWLLLTRPRLKKKDSYNDSN